MSEHTIGEIMRMIFQDSTTQKSSWPAMLQVWWHKRAHSVSYRRLEAVLCILQTETDAQTADQDKCWQDLSKQYLYKADEALANHDAELGWRLFKAASQARLYSATDRQSEATAILLEARDEQKKLSAWRRKSIIALLSTDDGKTIKDSLAAESVVKAQRLLDEQTDNTYYKLAIVKERLQFLAWTSFIILVTWVVLSPPVSMISPSDVEVGPTTQTADSIIGTAPLPSVVSAASSITDTSPITSTMVSSSVLSATTPDSSTLVSVITPLYAGDKRKLPPWMFWLSLIFAGMMGAVISSLTAAMQQDLSKSRIPEELSTSTVTFARLFLAALSAVVISLFLISGLLNYSTFTYELLLAIAVVSGFSERLLVRAMSLEPKS